MEARLHYAEEVVRCAFSPCCATDTLAALAGAEAFKFNIIVHVYITQAATMQHLAHESATNAHHTQPHSARHSGLRVA